MTLLLSNFIIKRIMIQVSANSTQAQNQNLILTQTQILNLLYQFKQSKTQEQVKAAEQQLRKMIVNRKNFTAIINMIISNDVNHDDKVLMISTMNFVVEELLKKHENIRNKLKSKIAHIQVDDLRRDIIEISTKMYKIIDSNTVPMHLKPKVVFLLLKLFNRSKEDWQSARLPVKMQYYFRKELICIAIAYINNIVKLGFSVRQKLQVINKAVKFLPECGGRCFAKLARQPRNESLNNDLSSILEQMLNLLKTQQSECRRDIVISWSNSQTFMSLIKAILQQPNNQTANYSYLTESRDCLEEWRDKLLDIFKKMSFLVYFHNATKQCYNFVAFFIQFIRHLWQIAYVSTDDDSVYKFEDIFGKYVVLFVNATNMRVLPGCFICSQGNYPLNDHTDATNLNIDDKLHIFKNYIHKIYQYFSYKINQLLHTTNKQTQTQTLQLFAQLCSAEQVDSLSQNFGYSYCIWLLTLVKQYKHIGYYVKNLVQCLLFSQYKQSINNLQWLQQQMAIVSELNPRRSDNADIGVLLCLVLYKNIVLDRIYLQECVGHYLLSMIELPPDHKQCIFNKSPKSICLFLLLLQNYMQQIPIYTTMNKRIKQYKLSQFIKLLITHLSHASNMGNLPLVYLSTIKKYIKLLKCVIRQYKQSPTYISYHKTIQFVQLEQPLREFHQLLTTVPIRYYTELYEEIIDYELFKIQGQSQADTISRVKVVINNVVTYYQNTSNYFSYGHRLFKMFEQICNCPEYIQLMGTIFKQVYKFVSNSKQVLIQLEQDAVNLCLMILKKPHIVAAMEQETLKTLWQIVYAVLEIYQWKQYTTNAEINFGNNTQDDCYVPQSSFTYRQLQLFYQTSNYIIPPELTTLIFKKSKQTVVNITNTLTYKKRNLLLAKYRPYQYQQITFLICLHKIIVNYCTQLTTDIVQELLGIYWGSYQFRVEFPDDFNYVNGKYNLIVILLLRYAWKTLWAVFSNKDPAIVNKIYLEIFYNEISYRVEYDAPLLVMTALPVLKRLWATNYEVDTYVLKYAHFLVGGCILCLDRIYQNYRCNKDDEVSIQAFKHQIKDPVLETQLKITCFVKNLTAGQPFVDEFQQMRAFYRKLRENQKTFTWFMQSMQLYVKMQVYLDQFHSVLGVMKMKKKNGMVIYRISKKVSDQFLEDQNRY